MFLRVLKLSAVSLVSFSSAALAEEAHVHGEAVMEIVIDEAGALISFEAPAIDIVGFEYLPKTDEEQAAIDAKIELLSDMASVVLLPEAAGCMVSDVHVDFEVEEHDGEVEHIAFHAEYDVSCSDAGKLTSLEATVFNQFPDLEEMEVEVVTPSGQKGSHVEPGETMLKL